ncbi:MAG: hypothetical protein M1812_006386 [Candelaria pacifica]|nr:MAG: hypothetical protein M1812_006386 [Candelaria pacifica]
MSPMNRENDEDISNMNSPSQESSHQKQSLLHDEHTGYGTVHDNATDPEEPPSEVNDEDAQIDPKVRRKVMGAMPALAIGIFLASADQTIVVSSYGKIGSEMQALNQTSWIATTYLITQTCFQPLYGKLSEIFGRKSTLLFAFAVFAIGTLLCGLSRTMQELLAARTIAGIGGGGMTTLVAILLSDVIPLPERGTWQGYNNIIYAAGLGVGAPLGGYFADHAGWRWLVPFMLPFLCIKKPYLTPYPKPGHL